MITLCRMDNMEKAEKEGVTRVEVGSLLMFWDRGLVFGNYPRDQGRSFLGILMGNEGMVT